MFRAVKNLNRKPLNNPFVFDKEKKKVTHPQEIHDIIKDHFKNHFYKEHHANIEPFSGVPRPLKNPITLEEIRNAVRKMTNNRAPGFDNISVELIKYAPNVILTEVADILNESFETHNSNLQLGKGQLATLWKPNKTEGPVENLRPVTLLPVLRKILSNVTLKRIQPTVDKFLPASQTAYRPSRSTTDIVWSYRWMLAKIQRYENLHLHVTGLDMSSAFDTINREDLLKTLFNLIDEDEYRMIQLLLADTTLEIKISNYSDFQV